MLDKERYSMGDALEACYESALDDWRKTYASSVAKEDLFAGPVRDMTLAATVHAAGRLTVTITIEARRRHESQAYFFMLQRQDGLWTNPQGINS